MNINNDAEKRTGRCERCEKNTKTNLKLNKILSACCLLVAATFYTPIGIASVELGDGTKTDLRGVSVGDGAQSGIQGIAVGTTSESGRNGVAIGDSAKSGDFSVSVGSMAEAEHINSVAIGNGSVTDRNNSVSFGYEYNKRQITNIAEGTEDTDGVNVKQLNDKADETLNSANNYTDSKITENNVIINQNIDNAKNEAISSSNQYTDLKITDTKSELNQNIDNAKNEAISSSNQHTDLKITDTKNELNQNIDNSKIEAITTSNNYTDIKITDNNVIINQNIDNSKKEAISISNKYTDQRFGELQADVNHNFNRIENKVNKNADRANAGIASVSAMASIPYTNENTFSMGLGLGNYRNGNAVAVGSQYRVSDNVNLRGSISWNNEDSAVYGAGFAFGF